MKAPRLKRSQAGTAQRLNDGIRLELRGFPAESVDAFVRSVGATLAMGESLDELSREESARLAELERLARVTRAFIAEIRASVEVPALARGMVLDVDEAMSPSGDSHRGELEAFYSCQRQALDSAERYLEQIELARRTAPRRRRGPKADRLGVLARVARRYVALFGERPTVTPGGTFSNIAVLIIEHWTGAAPRDVSRQVRAALKAM